MENRADISLSAWGGLSTRIIDGAPTTCPGSEGQVLLHMAPATYLHPTWMLSSPGGMGTAAEHAANTEKRCLVLWRRAGKDFGLHSINYCSKICLLSLY